MCLAVPGRIIRIDGDVAIIDYGANQREGKIIDGSCSVGEYVIVQGGIIVMKVSKKEAEGASSLYNKALKHQ